MIKEMDSIVEVTLLKCSSFYRQSSTCQPGDGSELLVSQWLNWSVLLTVGDNARSLPRKLFSLPSGWISAVDFERITLKWIRRKVSLSAVSGESPRRVNETFAATKKNRCSSCRSSINFRWTRCSLVERGLYGWRYELICHCAFFFTIQHVWVAGRQREDVFRKIERRLLGVFCCFPPEKGFASGCTAMSWFNCQIGISLKYHVKHLGFAPSSKTQNTI